MADAEQQRACSQRAAAFSVVGSDAALGPYGQRGAAGLAEVKAAAAGEAEHRLDDLPARNTHALEHRRQIVGIQHHQWAAFGRRWRGCTVEATVQAAVMEGQVIRAIGLKLPTEHRFEKNARLASGSTEANST